MPLYPEQRQFRADITDDDYRRWQDAVCRSIAGATAAELRSVLPTVNDARRAQTRHPVLSSVNSRSWCSAATRSVTNGWRGNAELADRSSAATFVATGTRSHNIHQRHPDLVADAIRKVTHRSDSSRA